MRKLKSIVMIAIIAILFLNSIIPIATASIEIGNSSDLLYEKELLGLLQFKSNGSLRLVIKVYYKDGNNKLPAFCVEPDKPRCWNWGWK